MKKDKRDDRTKQGEIHFAKRGSGNNGSGGSGQG
jgi:hypothetical protein